jgi:hypothetical protein
MRLVPLRLGWRFLQLPGEVPEADGAAAASPGPQRRARVVERGRARFGSRLDLLRTLG